MSQAGEELGPIDILVNNAGIAGPNRKTWEYTPGEFRRILEVNLTSAYICSAAVAPGMKERNYGRIVNISSVAGRKAIPTPPPTACPRRR